MSLVLRLVCRGGKASATALYRHVETGEVHAMPSYLPRREVRILINKLNLSALICWRGKRYTAIARAWAKKQNKKLDYPAPIVEHKVACKKTSIAFERAKRRLEAAREPK